MIVAKSLEDLTESVPSVVTVGTFDGVHRGHHAILEAAVATATSRRLRSVVLTFDPHPRNILGSRRSDTRVLSTVEERVELFQACNVDLVLLVRFTKDFAAQSARSFVQRWLVEGLCAKHVVVGHDHHFGKSREGSVSSLREQGEEFGFVVDQVGPLEREGGVVSSSRIRSELEAGNVEAARDLLGQSYGIAGLVVRGDQRGARIGFPTANLMPVSADKVIPGRGVYAVTASTEAWTKHGMMNIGVRPTVGAGLAETREVHLFGFSGELYGTTLRVQFLSRLREERRFDSLQALVAQLREDRAEAMRRMHE